MAFGVSLPITFDSSDGFTMLYSIRDTLKQNFKMLVLTNPGERVMQPDFGVGIRQFLFDNFTGNYKANISAKIHSQVKKYMPVIVIHSINYGSSEEQNMISIQIRYAIPDMGLQDLLELQVTT